MQLKHRVIAITGGAQGLGLSMAQALGLKGAYIALIDRDRPLLDHAVEALLDEGIEAKGYVADVSQEADVERAFAQLVTDWGDLHGLINNAGITRDGLLVKTREGKVIDQMSLQSWQAVIDVNLTGVFLCGRAAAMKMIAQGSEGLIVNIASISRAGNFGQSNYSAAKAGVTALAVTWAKELARHNIRCVAIAPGYIATEMTATMNPGALTRMTEAVPANRLGLPEEVAQLAVSLFENAYLNGSVYEINGGLRI